MCVCVYSTGVTLCLQDQLLDTTFFPSRCLSLKVATDQTFQFLVRVLHAGILLCLFFFLILFLCPILTFVTKSCKIAVK